MIIIFVDVQNLFVYIVPIELILLFSNEKNIIIMSHMYFAYKCKEEFCSNSKEHSFVWKILFKQYYFIQQAFNRSWI